MPRSSRSSKQKKRRNRSASRSSNRGPFSEPDTSFDVRLWHLQPVYNRFWQHYHSLMSTTELSCVTEHAAYAEESQQPCCQMHSEAGNPCDIAGPPCCCQMYEQMPQRCCQMYAQAPHHPQRSQLPSRQSETWSRSPNHSPRRRSSSKASRGSSKLSHNKRSRPKQKQRHSSHSTTGYESTTSELSSQLSTGMQIGDDSNKPPSSPAADDDAFLAFLEQSLRHKEEWRKKKTVLNGSQSQQETGVQEHPDVVRNRDMRRLYGAAAPRVHAMETSVQLSFDRVGTRHHPKLWPNIPINVVFGDD